VQALIQRVSFARVVVNDETVGEIDSGILLFLGVEKGDDAVKADRLLKKVLGYRIFPDADDKMNLSLQDVDGGLLVVSQFTLAADTQKGLRPSFSSAAAPADGERLYNYFVDQAESLHSNLKTGEFAADMKISLLNDGPVTFLLKA